MNFKARIDKIKLFLSGLSFRTGILILALCVPCYIFAFAQMALDLSVSMKGVLWAVFYGLAKTFQYAGLAIIGTEGIKKLRSIFNFK